MAETSSENTYFSLDIQDLHVSVEGREVVKGLTLSIQSGEIHAIMGPNGSGKSSLCYALMGHPKYEVTQGSAYLNGRNILELPVDQRAQLGLFLGFQYPREVAGITFGNFLRHALNAHKKAVDETAKPLGPTQFLPILQQEMKLLQMDRKFMGRSLNEGFSGGEKKRAEIVQMAVLQPKIALLDEIDSGLDIDALKIVAAGIQEVFERSNMGILLITHYQRILNHVTPHFVHIMADGEIIKSGDAFLAHELEAKGYETFLNAAK